MSSGWHLKDVSVEKHSMVEGGASRPLVFTCDKWLARDEGDGLVERELYPASSRSASPSRIASPRFDPRRDSTDTSPATSAAGKLCNYQVHVITSDVKGAGTDANVFIQLYGVRGKTGRL